MVRGSNVKRGVLDWGSDITKYWPRVTSDIARYELREGDLVIAMDGALVGKSYATISRFDLPSLLLQRVARIRSSKINQPLLGFWIASDYFIAHVDSAKTNTAIPHISPSDIRRFRIAIPRSRQEQCAIAEALSDVDNLLGSLDALIAKKLAIKQAAMQQLLSGKIRLPGFSGEWETKKLGDIASFFKGIGLSKAQLSNDGKQSCIHYGELFTNYRERIDRVLSRTDYKGQCFRSIANDVLMPTSDVTPNGLATASYMPFSDVIIGGDILVIRAPEDVLKGEFLAYTVMVHRSQIMRLVSGTTVFHLYARDMARFEFPMPSIEEQAAIVEALSDMGAEIDALEKRREKTRAIKQGMMQQLLTGRVRLVAREKKGVAA